MVDSDSVCMINIEDNLIWDILGTVVMMVEHIYRLDRYIFIVAVLLCTFEYGSEHSSHHWQDNGMRRGKPLYLNQERYAALTYMVGESSPYSYWLLFYSWYQPVIRLVAWSDLDLIAFVILGSFICLTYCLITSVGRFSWIWYEF